MFVGLDSLFYLDVGFNGLKSIPEGTFSTLNLTWLFLRYNDISQISAATFTELKMLRSLYLGNNPIQSLSDGTINQLTGLELLYLRETHIQDLLAVSIKGLDKLKILSFEGNRLIEHNSYWLFVSSEELGYFESLKQQFH